MAIAKEVDFNFQPYPLQSELVAAMDGGTSRAYVVWPRRCGKDRACFTFMLYEAMRKVGTYIYAFPEQGQARVALWQTIDMEGKTPLDYIPSELVYSVNQVHMEIKLRDPKDLRKQGSIIKIVGTYDGAQKLRGGNYMGVVLSEFAFMSPEVYPIIISALIKTNGWIILNTTVNGHNHAYKMWNKTSSAADWYNSYATCEQFVDENDSRVISAELIANELASGGMSQAKINQEFYCDWDAAIEGAVFSSEIEKAFMEGRIKEFTLGDSPVQMFLDIGVNKKTGCTAIWFVQFNRDDTISFVDYMEDSDQPAVYYVNKIKHWMTENGQTWGKCYLPHDSMQRDKIECNTYAKRYAELGMDVQVIPRIQQKAYAIEFTRQNFRKYKINSKKCERGVQALREYNWDTMHSTHWANHACDAFLAVGQYLNLEKRKDKKPVYQIPAMQKNTSAF